MRDAHNDVVMDDVANAIKEDDVDVVEDVVDGNEDPMTGRTRKGGAATRRGNAPASLVSVVVHTYSRQPSQIRTCRTRALSG